jgi:hypothetical protein
MYGLGMPPESVVVYDRYQYEEETGDTEMLACYLPERREIALSPGVFWVPHLVLHELAHHFQALAEGAEAFQKYDEYLDTYGYYDNPYEIEARDFCHKWWPNFDSLLRERRKR